MAAPPDASTAEELQMSSAGSLPLPSAAGMEKVQGTKDQPTQEQTAFGIAFQKADCLQFLFGAADKQADVGEFICVS